MNNDKYKDALDCVDWNLPGMEQFNEKDKQCLISLIEKGNIVLSYFITEGWAFWPTRNEGYYNSRLLRNIANFLDIQNKPFLDEQDRYFLTYEQYGQEEE